MGVAWDLQMKMGGEKRKGERIIYVVAMIVENAQTNPKFVGHLCMGKRVFDFLHLINVFNFLLISNVDFVSRVANMKKLT